MTENCIKIRKSFQNLELARDRLHLLTGKDKVILSAYLEGQSLKQLACLSNISRSALLRRLRKLISALTGENAELYLLALHHRSRFTLKELYIARDRLLLGLSLRQIAQKRKTTFYRSYYTVCKIERRIEQCKLIQYQKKSIPVSTNKLAKKPLLPAGCSA